MGDVRKLIEAVERGECSDSMFCAMFHRQGLCTECEAAFHGSLDAAKALHEALLPGWRWMAGSSVMDAEKTLVTVWMEAPQDKDWRVFCGAGSIASRAFLLAILRAMEGRE